MSTSPLSKGNFHPITKGTNLTIPDDILFVTVHDLAAETEGTNRENRFIVGLLLHVKACDTQNHVSLRPSSMGSKFGDSVYYNRFKKVKTSASYRRMFFFMDLFTQGKCFVVFERDQDDENIYWRDIAARGNSRVGDIFLITEPKKVYCEIKGHLSVVNTDGPFIPIKVPTTITSFMPSIPDRDTFIGYFLKGHRISVQNNISLETKCSGNFCDRLFPKLIPCGCYQSETRGAGIVFKQNVSFHGGFIGGETCVVTCSSLRFTELLFSNPIPSNVSHNTNIIPKLRQIRNAMKDLVAYVNLNGGWTIAGWFRPTVVSEVGTDDTVSDETFGFRISFIQPTDENIFTDDEFKALQKDPGTFLF